MLQRYLLYNPSYSPFVPYFVAMATRIDCGRIRLAAFDGPSTKTPLQTQKFCRYLSHKPSYISQSIKTHLYSDICRERIGGAFCPKFRCHGNGGRSRVNINDIANRLTQRLTFCDVTPSTAAAAPWRDVTIATTSCMLRSHWCAQTNSHTHRQKKAIS